MIRTSSAAALAFSPRFAHATDDHELTELASRFRACTAKIDDLEAREDALRKLEDRQMPDPPAALCRREADARLFRHTCYRTPKVGVGEPYERAEVEAFGRRRMMLNRDVPIKLDGTEFAPGETPPGRMYIDHEVRVCASRGRSRRREPMQSWPPKRNGTGTATRCASDSGSPISTTS